MPSKLRNPLALFVLFIAGPALAQEGQGAIDLFENQDSLPSGGITVESADGAPIVDGGEWDGSSSARVDGGITLTYERNGSSILVPAEVEGKSVYFVFDTGATYTTLTGKFAQSAGIQPKKGYPQSVVQTANGPAATQFGLINTLELGGRNHHGVTFNVCDQCPTGTYKGKPLVGLLGMNVIGRYVTSFDDARGVIDMMPSSRYDDRTRDVEPWLQFVSGRSGRIGKALVIDETIRNLAPRRIRKLALRIVCAGGAPFEWSKAVGPGGSAKIKETIHSGDCSVAVDRQIVASSW